MLLTPTYAAGLNVDSEEAHERLTAALASERLASELYEGLSVALAAAKGLRTTDDELIDKLAAGLQARRGRTRAVDATPAVSAVLVLINLEAGIAPEMMRATLATPKGRAVLDQGLRAIGAHLVKELIK